MPTTQFGSALVCSIHYFTPVKQNGWVSKCPRCCNANIVNENGQSLHLTAHSFSASIEDWGLEIFEKS